MGGWRREGGRRELVWETGLHLTETLIPRGLSLYGAGSWDRRRKVADFAGADLLWDINT